MPQMVVTTSSSNAHHLALGSSLPSMGSSVIGVGVAGAGCNGLLGSVPSMVQLALVREPSIFLSVLPPFNWLLLLLLPAAPPTTPAIASRYELDRSIL
jgi:hypothetical protein